ncbi:MAG: IS1634 family transposase [Lachnospiraceae bacterium]|nr:IS1634 family transposase [Lachnospiraceae bacterium]
MRLRIKNDNGIERLYIEKSIRISPKKVTTQNVEKLGRIDNLMRSMDLTRDEVIEWAQKRVDDLNRSEKPVILSLSAVKKIIPDEQRTFKAGYLFLQDIYYSMKFKNIFRNIQKRHKHKFDLDAITSDLIYARIIEPASKRASYGVAKTFLEPPNYNDYDIYRGLSILAEEMDFIQSEVYKNSSFVIKRNNRVLYYDCSNFYFEIEQADDLRKYGKSKEHRPNPIVQMGLMMDGDGIPIAFDLFDGSSNEQPSLKPLEKKVIKDFGFNRFIVCTDAGLASETNRRINNINDRAFVVTQSLKKLKEKERLSAMDDTNWKRLSDGKTIKNFQIIRENPEDYKDELFYKERIHDGTNVIGQLMIVTYSPSYAIYQKTLREAQLDRAEKMVVNKQVKKQRRNPNDPARFVKVTSVTNDGEIAQNKVYEMNTDAIEAESMYDGFYAVCTNLTDETVEIILSVSEGRWKIEESFRIMKNDFESRPVYVSREDRIKAHFLICFLSLLIFRILEKKTDRKYTSDDLIKTLRDYNLLKINGEGYIPEYVRTAITDHLHEIFNFRTDTEIIPTRKMREIISKTKK